MMEKMSMAGGRQHIKNRNYWNVHRSREDPFKRTPLFECSFYPDESLYHLISIITQLGLPPTSHTVPYLFPLLDCPLLPDFKIME